MVRETIKFNTSPIGASAILPINSVRFFTFCSHADNDVPDLDASPLGLD